MLRSLAASAEVSSGAAGAVVWRWCRGAAEHSGDVNQWGVQRLQCSKVSDVFFTVSKHQESMIDRIGPMEKESYRHQLWGGASNTWDSRLRTDHLCGTCASLCLCGYWTCKGLVAHRLDTRSTHPCLLHRHQ